MVIEKTAYDTRLEFFILLDFDGIDHQAAAFRIGC